MWQRIAVLYDPAGPCANRKLDCHHHTEAEIETDLLRLVELGVDTAMITLHAGADWRQRMPDVMTVLEMTSTLPIQASLWIKGRRSDHDHVLDVLRWARRQMPGDERWLCHLQKPAAFVQGPVEPIAPQVAPSLSIQQITRRRFPAGLVGPPPAVVKMQGSVPCHKSRMTQSTWPVETTQYRFRQASGQRAWLMVIDSARNCGPCGRPWLTPGCLAYATIQSEIMSLRYSAAA